MRPAGRAGHRAGANGLAGENQGWGWPGPDRRMLRSEKGKVAAHKELFCRTHYPMISICYVTFARPIC